MFIVYSEDEVTTEAPVEESTPSISQSGECPQGHVPLLIGESGQSFFSYEIRNGKVNAHPSTAFCGSNLALSLNRAAQYEIMGLGAVSLAQLSFEFEGYTLVAVELLRGSAGVVSMTYQVPDSKTLFKLFMRIFLFPVRASARGRPNDDRRRAAGAGNHNVQRRLWSANLRSAYRSRRSLSICECLRCRLQR